MTNPFLPTMLTPRLTDVTMQLLQQRGIRLVMLDFDNTIVPYTTNEPTEEMEAWLRQMAEADCHVCVVSNSRKDRVKKFCAEFSIDCITHANKPFAKGIRQCLERYGVAPEHALLVGDQIYTDTLGGNLCGVQTLLVKAVHNHNFWLKARHVLEKPWIYAARKRRLHHEEH